MDLLEQKAETESVFREIMAKGDVPASASVDFQFVPETEDADWDALTDAAEAKGYEVSWYQGEDEDDTWIEITAAEGPVTFDAIWGHEERLSLLAALHGFAAEGWGLYVSDAEGDD